MHCKNEIKLQGFLCHPKHYKIKINWKNMKYLNKTSPMNRFSSVECIVSSTDWLNATKIDVTRVVYEVTSGDYTSMTNSGLI